jgi:hypothetical protein
VTRPASATAKATSTPKISISQIGSLRGHFSCRRPRARGPSCRRAAERHRREPHPDCHRH